MAAMRAKKIIEFTRLRIGTAMMGASGRIRMNDRPMTLAPPSESRSAKAETPRGRLVKLSSAIPPTNAQVRPLSSPRAMVQITPKTSTGCGWAPPTPTYGTRLCSTRAAAVAPTAASR
jgi:hypothetical protein